jgi:hypothetical protein
VGSTSVTVVIRPESLRIRPVQPHRRSAAGTGTVVGISYFGHDQLVQIEQVFDLFPVLRAKAASQAGSLSGGEQKMLEIGRAMLLDFNYDTEPVLGFFPLPEVGPLKLLAESEANHLGKLAFRWIKNYVDLDFRSLPIPHLSGWEINLSGIYKAEAVVDAKRL